MSQSDSNPLTGDSTSDSSGADAQLNHLVRLGRSFSARERNCCFLNLGEGRFVDISAPSGVDFPEDGRGLAVVDWDGDGDLDLWVSNRTAPQVRLLWSLAGRRWEIVGPRTLQSGSTVIKAAKRIERDPIS